ncbi:MAG: hypothetical protein ACSLE9_04800 [Burkholderiaceae bacterium]
MTAPNLIFARLGSGNTLPAPYPFALSMFRPRSVATSARAVQSIYFLPLFGTGTIAGTTKIYSVPTNINAPTRRVRLYDTVSGVLARETISDASGNYAFANVDKLRTYYVTAFDGITGYDAVIHDNLTPV